MCPTAMQPDMLEIAQNYIDPTEMKKGANAKRTQSQHEDLQNMNELNLILIGDQGVGKT